MGVLFCKCVHFNTIFFNIFTNLYKFGQFWRKLCVFGVYFGQFFIVFVQICRMLTKFVQICSKICIFASPVSLNWTTAQCFSSLCKVVGKSRQLIDKIYTILRKFKLPPQSTLQPKNLCQKHLQSATIQSSASPFRNVQQNRDNLTDSTNNVKIPSMSFQQQISSNLNTKRRLAHPVAWESAEIYWQDR